MAIDWTQVNISNAIDAKVLGILYTHAQIIQMTKDLWGVNDKLPQECCGPRGGVRFDLVQQYVIDHWDYQRVSQWTRAQYFASDKFKDQQRAGEHYSKQLNDYQNITGKLLPPRYQDPQLGSRLVNLIRQYHPSQKDIWDDDSAFIHAVLEVIKEYTSSKTITSDRNDAIEVELLKNNPELIPTLKHIAGVDFIYHGCAFDQKVANSTGDVQPDENGVYDPQLIAKWMLENQSMDRFNNTNRLFIVYTSDNPDEDSLENLKYAVCQPIDQLDTECDVSYQWKNGKQYQNHSIVILI